MYPTRKQWLLSATSFAVVVLFSFSSNSGASKTDPRNPLLRNHTFIVFDVETTGLSPTSERIVELGAVKIENGIIVDEKSWLINPRKRISKSAQNVHGISYDMIKRKRIFKTQYPEIAAFMGDAILLAHNARFDRDFLYNEINNSGYPIPENPVVDTLRLFRNWYPKSGSHSLGSLADELHVSGGTLHRGLDDSVYAAEIFLIGMNQRGAPRSLKNLYKLGKLDVPKLIDHQ